MKTTLFVKAASVVALLLLSSTVNAKSWRIHNDTKYHPHFTDINAAMSSAEVQAGDTLYLDPGCTLLSEQNITKAVTIIGNGYFLQNGMVPATIQNKVWIKATNTKLVGVTIISQALLYKAENVTFERCKILGYISVYAGYGTRYGLTVQQCYLNNTETVIGGHGGNALRNATIKNNIIIQSSTSSKCYAIENVHDSEISNNYIISYKSAYNVLSNITNSKIYNNIISNGTTPNYVFGNSDSGSNNTFHHNVVSATEGTFTNATDIVWLGTADFSAVFAEGANDAAFRLKEGSPAKGAAADGGDCGPYGGATPYVEGGKPLYHPFINDITVSAKPVNGKIKLNLNAKMQNE